MTPIQTLSHLLIELNLLEATGRVLLKVHTIELAMGKHTSSLSLLDQTEMEM